MISLVEEHPTATHFMFIAASGEGGDDGNKSAFAWWLMSPKAETLASGNNTLTSSVADWSNAALLQAVLEAVSQGHVPEGARLHVISDQKSLTDLLRKDRAIRRAEGYLKTSGEPLAYAEKWRELDIAFDDFNLHLSAGRAKSGLGKDIFLKLKGLVAILKNNIDNDDDWTSSLGPSKEIGINQREPKDPATSAVPGFPADWRWLISNSIPPPVKPAPKKRKATGRK